MLRLGPVDSWDPQRLYVAADMAFAGRVFERTLTAWAPATGQDTLPDLAPDLATDTGTVAAGAGRGASPCAVTPPGRTASRSPAPT